jgi:hypothetical protein
MMSAVGVVMLLHTLFGLKVQEHNLSDEEAIHLK